jgi:hypothetical protein
MLGKLFLAAACALVLAAAANADPPPPQIVTGLDAGWPDVRGWNSSGGSAQQFAPWGSWNLAFSAYDTYQQGVRVAVGDVNGDGRNEIVTAPGKDAWTELKVFDGRTFQQLKAVLPFKDATWWAGAYVATGDTNGDGRDEIVEGLDAGCCTTLHVLDGITGNDLAGFYPYGNTSEVGARVAAGDLNGDGTADVIAVPLGSTRISAFRVSGGAAFRTIDAFGGEITGPIAIAAGNLTGDARAEIVAAAPTASGAEVKIFNASTGTAETTLAPYGSESVSSVAVALGDVNGDGSSDIVLSADTPDGTEVEAVDANGVQLADFYVLDASIVPGASIAAGDLDGDGKAEIVLGGGPTIAPWPLSRMARSSAWPSTRRTAGRSIGSTRTPAFSRAASASVSPISKGTTGRRWSRRRARGGRPSSRSGASIWSTVRTLARDWLISSPSTRLSRAG